MSERAGEEGRWRAMVVKNQATQPDNATSQSYQEQLAEVLRDRDVFRFRDFIIGTGRQLPDEMLQDPLKMATMMHQLILSLPQLADLHEFSQNWLNDNTLIPNGSLNEAARRAPGTVPAPQPGRRVINLQTKPKTNN